MAVFVEVSVTVGVLDGDAVVVGVIDAVTVAVAVLLGVWVGLGVSVDVFVAVAVGVLEAVAVGVALGNGVATEGITDSVPNPVDRAVTTVTRISEAVPCIPPVAHTTTSLVSP